jgi:phosphohistidine phosphatase SixA
MRVFLLRHADAVPGNPDATRDLSAKGQRQVADLAKGAGRIPLASVLAIEHSPLVRAVRTAQMLRMLTGSPLPLKVLPGLEPAADPRRTAAQLAKTRRDRLVVGHNPHLAAVGELLLGLPAEGLRLRKAGLLALERTARPTRTRPFGGWRLLWYIVPDPAK